MNEISEKQYPKILTEFEKFIMDCVNPYDVKVYHESISKVCSKRLSDILDRAKGDEEVAQSNHEDAKECMAYINQFDTGSLAKVSEGRITLR